MPKENLRGFRLSPYQKHVWRLQSSEPGLSYRCQVGVLIDGHLDPERLLRALQQVVRDHEILRTGFRSVPGMNLPLQVVSDGGIEQIERHDWAHLDPQERWGQLRSLFLAERESSIDLERGRPLRASLITLSPDEQVFMLGGPALCADRKSMVKLVGEVGRTYAGSPRPRESSGDVMQYSDFAAWHSEVLESGADVDHAFWFGQRLPAGAESRLPDEREATAEASFEPRVLTVSIRPEIARDIDALCAKRHLPVDRFLLGCWAAFLGRSTGHEELVVGTTVDFHGYRELEQTLGLLTSYAPLKVALDPRRRLRDLIEEIGHSLEEMSAHQEYFVREATVEASGRPSRSFDLPFCFEFVEEPPRFDAADLSFSLCENYACIATFKLSLVCFRRGDSLAAELHYDGGIISQERAEQFAARFHRLLESVTRNPDATIVELDILTDADRQHLLVELNATGAAPQPERCLHELFEQQADRTPRAVAVVFRDQEMGYAELNGRANQLAHRLRGLGIGPEAVVPVCVNRSFEMMVAVLGVMKAGAAYAPLDPSDPTDRLDLLLRNLRSPLLLTQRSLAGRFPDGAIPIVYLDGDGDDSARESTKNPASGASPANLAYVIHTSGSTGLPKGVMVPHEGLVNYLSWSTREYDVPVGRGSIVHSGFGVDLTVTSLLAPLLAGQTVTLLPEERGFAALPAALRNGGDFSFVKTTPGQMQVLNQMLTPGELDGSTRVLVLGGEQLLAEDVAVWRAHAPGTRLVNEYGPTETVVGCCSYEIPPDGESAGAVPIGRPIANAQVYLLDQRLQPVPAGVPGELYVGGTCVGRGYLNQPALTAEKFIPDPFSAEPGARLYRTGDLARLRPDDNIEFVGRTDHQVKIRGYRVEPGEVQQTLAQHPMVRQSAVVARDDRLGGKRLVAYVVPDRQDSAHATVAELRGFLGRKLPEHMVPAAFVLLKAIPLTASGKVNVGALPDADSGRPEPGIVYTAPRTLEEEVLAAVWSEVLKTGQVGIDDNYFALGGDSIRSLQVVARARKRGLHFSMDRLFSNPTIRDLARSLRTGGTPGSPATTTHAFSLLSPRDLSRMPADVEDAYPLTMLQGGMLFHRAASPASSVYHDIFSLHLKARLDIDALRAVIRQLIGRHPALRTSFDISSFSEPLQLVHRTDCVPLEVVDLRHLPPDRQDDAVSAWIREDKVRGFDPAGFPLVRFHVHVRSDESFQFSGSFHHAIIDGWSDAVMVTEIFEHYLSVLNGEVVDLEPTTSSFRDFVFREREALRSQEHQRYWNEKLDEYTLSALPRTQSDQGSMSAPRVVTQIEVPLADEVSEGLKRFALSTTVPLKSVLLAAHLRVLSVISSQSDVLTCVVSSGRLEDMDGERVLGLFLNSVPFRLKLSGGSWKDLVLASFAAEQEMLPFRRYPMAELKRRQGGKPLSETLFYFTNYHVYQSLQRFDATLLSSSFHEESSFPLIANFRLDPFTSKLFLDLQGDERYLSRAQLEAIGGYYQRALGSVAAEPEARYERVSLLSAAEEREQLVEWNATARPYGAGRCIHDLFEAQVERTPETTAVVWGAERWTYRELNARAEQVAARLRARGVGPEALVGVCMERGLAMVAALVGVLKAGGAYVPLDPGYPAERLAFMLADAGVRVVLSEERLRRRIAELGRGVGEGVEVLCVDADADADAAGAEGGGGGRSRVSGRNLAYVIYTSGSTGKPKGVGIEHHSLVNLLEWAREEYAAVELAGVLASTSICFDLSLFELFVPLSWGGTVLLVEDALQLGGMPARAEVRLINTVPSVMGELLQQPGGMLAGVRTINLAGEPLRSGMVRALYERGVERVVDLYGPTEETTYATFGGRQATGPETIGRPIANTRLYVLDAHQQPVPVGVAGELYLGGAGQARGYLGRPELTAERFVPDPWSGEAGARLYRTGDKGRYLPDGRIEFLGRADEQVKLRGYRIELGEVEAALAEYRGVQEAVVVVRDEAPGGRRLVGYVVGAADQPPAAAALRGFLGEKLPHYMVPAQFVVLDALPRTPNGKVDRRALPAPESTGGTKDESYASPRTPTEAVLAKIWAEVLGLDSVGVRDNFFELGGDSILSLQIVARANQAGLRLTHKQIFQHQTISGLAETVVMSDSRPAQQDPVSGPLPLTPIQRWLLDEDLPNPHHWNQAVLLETEQDIDPSLLRSVLERVLLHHDALRLRFESRDDNWHQVTAPPDMDVPFTRIDFSHIPAAEQSVRIEESAAEWQTTLDIAAGPLARVILYDLGVGPPGRVLIIVHHLAVDGISWRILLEDIQQGYLQLSQGRDVRLPAKTTSYRDWAYLLDGYAGSDELRSELPFWSSGSRSRVRELPLDFPSGANENSEGSARVVSLSLTPDDTRALLQQVPAVYHTQINDVLLAALGNAFSRWTGADSLSLDLEGHGREPISDDIDLSRTVGWFTAVFPITLDSRRRSHPGALLKSVKEQLRRIPNRGMGYGVLYYLSRDAEVIERLESLPRPQVIFNYLGQFGQVLPKASMFRLARESTGPTHGPLGARRYLLEVRAGIYEDRLKVDWTYSGNAHRSETISELAHSFMESLRAIIHHCGSPEAGGYTPSDFPLAKLDQQELDELLEGTARAVEDIYPLAPMQAGMLFHTLHAPDSAAYCMQVSCTIRGPLDVPAFGDAWREVVRRHPVLRTTFPADHGRDGLQIVHRDTDLKISTEDWRNLPSDRQATELEKFRESDRTRAFDLFSPPLFRLALFRVGEDRHECVWTYHHLILDGWSAYSVLKEVFASYQALCAGQQPHLPAVRPYADYMAWLQQKELSVAEIFWRETLRGLAGPTLLGPDAGAGSAAGVADLTREHGEKGYGEQRITLSSTETTALQDFARQHRLTMNTVVRGAWALVLNHYHRSNDVLFGATVTGRPPELAGVESMVGAFINTLPVRVQISPDEPLRSWLGTLQDQQAELHRYEHTPLMRILEWSELPNRSALFDSILVFENFPVDFSLDQQWGGVEILNVRSTINENYPIIVVVEPSSRLSIHIKYDRSLFNGLSISEILKGVETLLRASVFHVDSPVRELEELLSRTLGQERLRAHRDRKDVNVRKLQRMRGNAPHVSIDGNGDSGEE